MATLADTEGRKICGYERLVQEDYHCMRHALEGEEYCALHLRSDEKPFAEFVREVRESIDNPVDDSYDLIGAYFPKNTPLLFFYNLLDEFDQALDLRLATFACPVTFYDRTFQAEPRFDGAEFLEYADFRAAEFIAGVEFGGAHFSAGFTADAARFVATASFTLATFDGIASFKGAKFETGANFIESTFNDAAWFELTEFNGALSADNAAFNNGVAFTGAKIGGENVILTDYPSEYPVSFVECSFDGKSDFGGAEFRQKTDFMSARFKERAIFSRTIFKQWVGFRYAFFDRSALFRGTKFEKGASLTAVACGSPTLMQFMDHVDLSQVELAESDVSRWSFQSVEWRPLTRPLVGPWGRQKCIGVADEEISTHKTLAAPETLQVLYRRLQDNYENAHGYGTAGDFHIGAMESRRRDLKLTDASWWLLSVYRFVSLYGERWFWALGLLVGLFLGSSALVVALSNDVGFLLALNNCLRIVTFQSNLLLKPVNSLGAWGETALRIVGPVQIAILALAVRRQSQR